MSEHLKPLRPARGRQFQDKYTAAQKKEVVDAVAAGMSCVQAAKLVGCSTRSVYIWCDRAGVDRRVFHHRHMSNYRKKVDPNIRKMLLLPLSLREIARACQVSVPKVLSVRDKMRAEGEAV